MVHFCLSCMSNQVLTAHKEEITRKKVSKIEKYKLKSVTKEVKRQKKIKRNTTNTSTNSIKKLNLWSSFA